VVLMLVWCVVLLWCLCMVLVQWCGGGWSSGSLVVGGGGGGHKIKTWGEDDIDFLLYLGKCWPNFVSALMILQQHSTLSFIIFISYLSQSSSSFYYLLTYHITITQIA